MKLQTLLVLLPLLYGVESSKYNDLTHVVDNIDASNSARSLQGRNFNCQVSVDAKCFLMSNGSKCEDLPPVRTDLCGMIDVRMQYTYCNNQDAIVIVKKDATEITFYNDPSNLTMDKSDMTANECRTENKFLQVNTCKRNWFVADIKLEGWKVYSTNPNNYCFDYFHYYHPIRKYELPQVTQTSSSPTEGPTETIAISTFNDFSFECMCYLETVVGSGQYSISCSNINVQYFTASYAPYKSGIVEIPDYKRNTKIICMATNLSDQDADIISSILQVTNTDDHYDLDFANDISSVPPVLSTREPLVFWKQILVDYAKFSGQTIELIPEAWARGQISKEVLSQNDKLEISVPVLQFQWELDYTVQCLIIGSSQTCQDYLASMVNPGSACQVDVEYKMMAKHTGNKCEYINALTITIESFPNVLGPIYIPVNTWTDSKRTFCPGETLDIKLSMAEDLCDKAGKEVMFDVNINNIGNPLTLGLLTFPESNVVSIPPVLAPVSTPVAAPLGNFDISIDPNVICWVPSMSQTCQQVLANSSCPNGATVEVLFRADVRNVGTKCGDITDATIKVVTIDRYAIDIESWSNSRRQFCPGESLDLVSTTKLVDLCEYEGMEANVRVAVNDNGDPHRATGYISFPVSNNIPSPTPLVPQAPTSTSGCGSNPNTISFNIRNVNYNTCSGRRERRLNGRKLPLLSKGGKGSKKNPPPAQPPSSIGLVVPPPQNQCNSCIDSGVAVSSSDLLLVTIYSSDDPSTPLYSGQHSCNDKFNFSPSNNMPMPDCLIVKISKIGFSVVDIQTITFEASCCNVGASYGLLEIVSID